jgi:uncharacterized protein (DUF1800 family)
MAQLSPLLGHLLRRAGFGARPDERESYSRLSYVAAVDALTSYDPETTDIDGFIGTPGYAGITTRGQFSPTLVIEDARQRWLFRMVHSPAPLQEKMTLFWHHHFATAYSKLAGIVGTTDATRMMAAKPSEDPGGAKGQLEILRENALGNFRDLLVTMAQDIAMMYWLDNRLNTRTNPQENFGRELMELFTFGVENYTEPDVYAAARVFSGWGVARTGTAGAAGAYWRFNYNAAQHDTNAKEFSFAVYPGGGRRIEARGSASGMQDGLDLIAGLAIHPETAKRMARRLWGFFVSETVPPDASFVDAISKTYLQNDTNMRPVIRAVLTSKAFVNPDNFFQRYSWPAEFVARAMKEVGYVGFSVDTARSAMINMGQQLYEPPDVNGWDTGAGWFSTGGMLARMNFAAQLAQNQRFVLRDAARPARDSPESMVDFALGSTSISGLSGAERDALLTYVRAGGTWTGSETQLLNKSGGLFHLLAGSGEFQFV